MATRDGTTIIDKQSITIHIYRALLSFTVFTKPISFCFLLGSVFQISSAQTKRSSPEKIPHFISDEPKKVIVQKSREHIGIFYFIYFFPLHNLWIFCLYLMLFIPNEYCNY